MESRKRNREEHPENSRDDSSTKRQRMVNPSVSDNDLFKEVFSFEIDIILRFLSNTKNFKNPQEIMDRILEFLSYPKNLIKPKVISNFYCMYIREVISASISRKFNIKSDGFENDELDNFYRINLDIKYPGLPQNAALQLERIFNFSFYHSIFVPRLNLSVGEINDEHLRIICEFLKKNPYITTLDLTGNRITDEGAKLLARNKTLLEFKFAGNPITNLGLKAIVSHRSLQEIAFSPNTYDTQIIANFAEASPSQRASYGREAGIEIEVPSLKRQVGFFIQTHPEIIEKGEKEGKRLPDDLKEFLDKPRI